MLLALDTATRTIGIALHDGSQVLAESIWYAQGHHTVGLAPEVALLLRRVSKSPASLTGIAVAQGPGSYTGLRIGIALAKGLSIAHNLPLIGVPTLDVLVHGQPHRPEPMLAVIEAGRERLLGVWYKWGHNGWQSMDEMVNFIWSELREILLERAYICGELDLKGRQILAEEQLVVVAPPASCVRRPSVLAELAWQKIRSGKITDPSHIAPIYYSMQS